MKSKSKKNIHLIDVTTRDGSYLLNFNITPTQVATLVDYLDYAGISHIEIGHGAGIGAARLGYSSSYTDLQYVTEAKKVAKNIRLGVLMPALSLVIPDFEELASLLDFARIGTMPGETEKAELLVKKAKEFGLTTFINLTRSSALPAKKIAQEAAKAQKMGADIIYLVDSMGSFTPETIREYVSAIKDKTTVPLGFHGHNNLGLANINSLTAVEEGCTWIDASILGVGRQAGNTQLETLALLLEKNAYPQSIKLPFLLDVAATLVAPMFKTYKGIDAFDVWAAYLNLDLYPPHFYLRLAVELGLSPRNLALEISKMKGCTTLDDQHLKDLIKKMGKNYHEVIQAIQKT